MDCGKCGFQNREGRKFCANCGSPIMAAGVGHGGGAIRGGAAAPPLPTVPESGQTPQIRVGGAAAPTVQEGAGPRPAGMAGGAPRTVLHDEASKPLAGWLVVVRSRTMQPYKELPIFVGSNVFGRDGGLGQQRVDDPNASGQHALVLASADGVRLTDMGSANGTAVNGAPVQSAELAGGDVVRIGKTSFRFVPVPSPLSRP